MAVAARFYHQDDMLQLQLVAPEQQANVCRMLWQLKECVVKIQQPLLIPTLRQSHTNYVTPLTQLIELNSSSYFSFDSDSSQDCGSYQNFTPLDQRMTLNSTEYQLAVLPNHTVMIIY